MLLQQVPYVTAALFLAFTLQSTVGFGGGLVAIPILLLAGFSLPQAVAISLVAGFVHTAYNCYRYREHIPWRFVWPMFLYRAPVLPLGLYLMTLITEAGQSLAKQVVGAAVGVAVLIQLFARVQPRDHLHPALLPLAASTSGLSAATIGMGGPPLVLWIMAHDWPANRSRACLWTLFITWIPLQLAAMIAMETFMHTTPVAALAAWTLAFIPVILLATLFGNAIGKRLNRNRLRFFAYALLLVIAAVAITSPLL